MNGILNVLKPPGMTSSEVVVFLRKKIQVRKIGHTGTLDPEAAGVLPVCIGRATRLADYMMRQDKINRCYMKLSITTDSYDQKGKTVKKSDTIPTLEKIEFALEKFQGEMDQVPPMHSAIKIGGKKLYELARQGIEIESEPRKIWIKRTSLISFMPPDMVLFDIICSKGTYIRSLCNDIGQFLGCGAVMAYLIRTSSGIFHLNNSHTLDEICIAKKNNKLNSLLVPMEEALEGIMPSIFLKNDCKEIISRGNLADESCIVKISELANDLFYSNKVSSQTLYRVFCGNVFMGIGYFRIHNNKMVVQMKKVLI